MITGMKMASRLDRKVLTISLRLGPPSPLGRLSRRPSAAITPMHRRQINRPGRIPAANRPAIETPISEP